MTNLLQFILSSIKKIAHQRFCVLGFVFLLHLFSVVPFSVQSFPAKGKIQGRVFSANTKEPLARANVHLVGTTYGSATDENGHYEISGVPVGIYSIKASFIGYKAQTKDSIQVSANQIVEVDFWLKESPLKLKELIVSPGHFAITKGAPGSRRALNREQLKEISIFGGNVYHAMKHLPGVTGNDFSSKFAVRGGNPDEVLVLFDGLELYEPFHLKDIGGGVFSIIDLEAIGDIELFTGGFPAEYGDKMSGVFNIRSARPSSEKRRTSIGVSLLNARFFTEGHFRNDKGSWLVSARRGYLDLLMRLTGNDEDFLPEYYDVLGIVRYRLNKNHSLSAHFLHAGDQFKFIDKSDDEARTSYGNTYGWLTLNSILNDNANVRSILSTGHLDESRNANVYYPDNCLNKKVNDDRNFDFVGLKQNWFVELSKSWYLKWGFEGKNYDADYDYFKYLVNRSVNLFTGDTITTKDTTAINTAPNGYEFGCYASNRIRITSSLTAEVGLRYDFQSYTKDKSWSPRLNVAYSLGDQTVVKAGWGSFYQSQNIHKLDIEDGITTFFPAELAEHRVIGIEHQLGASINLRVEAYQKKLLNIRPKYINLIGTLDVFPELSGDRTREEPEFGESKGVEIYLKQDVGDQYSWWLSYCFAEVKDRIVNRYVHRPFDQRHTVDFNFNYNPNQWWSFNLTWQYHSGWPYTPMHLEEDQRLMGGVVYKMVPGKLRGARLSDYHRLDLRMARKIDISMGQLNVFIEVINAYNNHNIKTFDYEMIENEDGSVELKRIDYNWLPILPSVGIGWEF